MTALGVPASSWADIPSSTLELTVERDLQHLRGLLRAEVLNSTERPLDEVLLWLPFNRLSSPPAGMDQRNAHWIYPRAFAPGRISLVDVQWNSQDIDTNSIRPRTLPGQDQDSEQPILVALALPQPLEPGELGTLSITFSTEIPRRFGRLGHARGTLTLAGGFHPQVAALSSEGWVLDGPLAERQWHVLLHAPSGMEVVLNGEHRVVPDDGGSLQFSPGIAPYVALIVARRFYRTRINVGQWVVEFLSRSRRYQRPQRVRGLRESLTPSDVGDATRWDWQGRALATARQTVLVLNELGLAPSPGEVIRLIEVPLRLEIVSPIPGGALISDRAYRVTPLEQFFRFYDLQVARAVGWIVLEDVVERESLVERSWVLDFLAAAVADAFAYSQHGGRGPGLRRLLRIGAFIPEIDQMLYSPLIEFRHLFLRPFQDEDPVREEPWRLATTWPRGAVLHDKLIELIGLDRVQNILRSYGVSETPLRTLVAQEAQEEMDWFFAQWLGPYPEVNYRQVNVSSEELDDGRFRHRVTVERQGAVLREPVEVRFYLRNGEFVSVTWDGRGQSGEVTVEAPAPLSRVVLDPRRRLVESSSIPNDNPLFDNVSPPRWRPPVLNGLLLYLSASERAWYALVDFSLRRQFDARRGVRLRLEYDPRGLRGDLFYQHGLGRLLNLNRASWVISAGINVLRTLGDFGDNDIDATAFGASCTLYHDTRWYPYDPMEGWGLQLSVFGSGSVSDDGVWGYSVGTSGRVAGHWTPRVGHTFTGYFGAGIGFGNPLDEQLQSISDRSMLRAFEADETLGRARLYTAVEYRWTVIHDLDINLLQLAWIRALFLVAFVGGGTVSDQDGLGGMFSTDRLFSEVGGGLRVLLDIAGVQPYIIAVDLAYPLTPRERVRCSETQCVPRTPIGVYVSIQHTL